MIHIVNYLTDKRDAIIYDSELFPPPNVVIKTHFLTKLISMIEEDSIDYNDVLDHVKHAMIEHNVHSGGSSYFDYFLELYVDINVLNALVDLNN